MHVCMHACMYVCMYVCMVCYEHVNPVGEVMALFKIFTYVATSNVCVVFPCVGMRACMRVKTTPKFSTTTDRSCV